MAAGVPPLAEIAPYLAIGLGLAVWLGCGLWATHYALPGLRLRLALLLLGPIALTLFLASRGR